MKHDLKQIAARLAAGFFSPAGPIPVERLVAGHLDAFEDMRTAGLTWEQISRLLAGAGILRGDGSAFPPSHLRGVYGRQRKRLQKKRAAKSPERAAPSASAGSSQLPGCSSGSRAGMSVQESGYFGNLHAVAAIADTPSLQDDGDLRSADGGSGTAVGAMTAGTKESLPDHDRNRVLALMRQAALARRLT